MAGRISRMPEQTFGQLRRTATDSIIRAASRGSTRPPCNTRRNGMRSLP